MRLGGEDTAWLRMGGPTNPMIVNALVELDGTLDVARLWSVVEARGLPPRFRARVKRRAVGVAALVPDPHFDVANHVVHVQLEPGEAAMRAFVGREIATQLDPSRPLWRTIVIDREGSPTSVLFRVHHALADGFALLDQLFTICDEGAPTETPPETHGSRRAGVIRRARALGRLVTLPPDPPTSLKAPLGVEKTVAWSRTIPLDAIKRIAHDASATVNDVLVSIVSGAIRRSLDARGERADDVHAMVPVNLRHGVAGELGNHFGLVILALPVAVSDAAARLAETKRRMDRLKKTPEAFVALDLLALMGHLPVRLEALGAAFFAKKTSLVLTNVPGPRAPLHIAGVGIARIVFWVPQAARLGLGVSIFSYAGQITIGVLADAHVLADATGFVDAIEEEVAALQAPDRMPKPAFASTRGEKSIGAYTTK